MASQNIPKGFVLLKDAFHKIAAAEIVRIIDSEYFAIRDDEGKLITEAIVQYRRDCLTFENASRVYKAKKAGATFPDGRRVPLPKGPPLKPVCPDGVRKILNVLVVNGIPIETIEEGVRALIRNGDLPIFAVQPDGLLRRLKNYEINRQPVNFIFTSGRFASGAKTKTLQDVVLQKSNLEALTVLKPPSPQQQDTLAPTTVQPSPPPANLPEPEATRSKPKQITPSKKKRPLGEPKPQTVKGWKESHDDVERSRKINGDDCTDIRAANHAALDSIKNADALLRDRRRYIAHLKAAKRQK